MAVPSKLESQLQASLDRINYDGPEPDGDDAPPTYPFAPPARNGDGNRHKPAPVPVNGNSVSALRVALFAAIDDAAEAERYAASKGMSIRFSADDLSKQAITLLIGMQKGGR